LIVGKSKNSAAVSLAKIRNEKVSLEQKKKIASLGGKARATSLSKESRTEISKSAGKLGGVARADKLSPQERSDIAKKAAAARWGKKPERPTSSTAFSDPNK
jgi:hypothetical protein